MPGAAMRSSSGRRSTAMRSTFTATAMRSSAAASRTLERLGCLRVLPLEGLHLIRVLTL